MRCVVILSVVVLAAGCNNPDSELQLTSSSVPGPELYSVYETSAPVASPAEAPAASSNFWGNNPYASQGVGQTEPMLASATGDRTHVVQRRDTLFGLARTYYGDAGQWKKIYHANQRQIPDPNRIQVGMKLVIP